MKKTHFTAKIAIDLVLCLMTLLTASADFAKANTYAEGTFTDVKSDAWYKNDVASAYELGFMNGTGSGKFSPDGNVTVAEAITMASRVHSINNGTKIADKQGAKNWYDMYVDYATANGLITKDTFENYDRNAMRYEVASLFANAMPASHFAAKNDVKDIPDIAETEEYYDELMMLYKAGVVMGSTEYGDFLATNPIKRSETAAIINRVALPENRLSKTLKEYGNRDQAVYLINDVAMGRNPREVSYIASGWTYDNPGSTNAAKKDYSSQSLVDTSDKYAVTARKTVAVQTHGKVVFESILTINNNGANILLEDSDRNVLFGISVEDGKYKAIGKTTVDTGVAITSGQQRITILLDLDTKKATVVLNSKEAGTYDMSGSKDLASVAYKTGDKAMVTMGLLETYMYTQYAVNDTFRMAAENDKLYGWNTTDNVTVLAHSSDYDKFSAAIQDAGTASTKFDAVSGKFVYETFVKVPANQTGTLELKNGDKSAVKVEIGGGKITSAGKLVREYNNTLWNLIRIEGDTNTGKALIRVNGKKEGTEVALSEKAIDTVAITSAGTGKFWFDDVQIYNVYDYADYVPTPVPVNNDGYYLGMSICSLWREGTHYGWDCISPYNDVQPILGYYDEGLPEVADWEIKFLAEHGYDFEHFCWYYNSDTFKNGIKEPRMGFALHDGYMNAKYSDMVKFAIMWENWGAGNVTKDIFLNEIWPYWCEWYFSDSRYMSINNKAVMTIYRHPKFIEHMGGVEAAKEVIDFMKEDIKKLGYDGMIVLGTSSGSLAENIEAEAIGIDGFVAYHFGEAAYDPEHQFNSLNAAYDNDHTPFFPSIGVGFNDIGWTETRTPLITVEDHKSVFEWAKNDYMPRLAKREGEEWMGKIAIANTWNEFGEGHYIFPTNLNKFGYLDAARQVFSTAAGKDDKKHFDIEPTDNQKSRLGYLYQTDSIPLRRTQYISDDSAIADNAVVKAWNFENEADCAKWASLAKTSPTKYDPVEKALTAEALQTDSHIKMLNLEENYFNANEVRYIHIKMKTDKGFNTNLEWYYSGETGNNWSSGRRAAVAVGNNGEYIDYYLDMAGKPEWNGTIKAIRFDPMGALGNFWIKEIRLLSDKAANGYNIKVGGVDYNFNTNFFKKVGEDVYVGGNPTQGFYSLNSFYYEWNRWTGKLMIRTYTDHQFEFTVGSNKVLVDGKEKTISAPLELSDGLPMLPILFIYDNAEYTYEKVDGGLNVTMKGVNVEEILKSRKPNEYEFNVPGDNEGWRVSGAGGGVIEGGVIYLESTFNGTRYDPQVVLDKQAIKTTDYNRAEVRYKPIYKDDLDNDQTVSLYFATTEDPNLNEKKKAWASHKNMEPDADGFYTLTLDLASLEGWTGNATIVRFDPPNRSGEYYIDYIRFLVDPEKEAKAAAAAAAKAEAMKAYMGADKGEAFFIENADAEAEVMASDYGTGNATVVRTEDDLKKGNHAFLVTPKDNSAKRWTYFIANTRFKPGATYKVDFDFRVVSDHYGADATDVRPSINFRYTDVIGGEVKNAADHAMAPNPKTTVSTKDGWTHYSAEHTVSAASPDREQDFFTIFVDPRDTDAGFINFVYMIDNIKVTVVDAGSAAPQKTETKVEEKKPEETKPAAAPAGDPITSIKFDKAEMFRAYNIDGLSINGTCKGVSATNDPNVVYLEKVNLKANDIKSIKIKAKLPKGSEAEMYFSTPEKPFSGSTRFAFTSYSDEAETYVIDTTANENWKDTILEFRFDPVVGEGKAFEWYSIEFCK